ncbi:MAG: hypothetical protein K2X25_10575 [Caulobacteraceae bacterium]|nr:hypothetical protein [Caulobacteraceae bacterium]
MTRAVRRPHPFFRPRPGNLLAATVLVLAASVWLLRFPPADLDPTALLSGAWTMLAMIWGLYGLQVLRRRSR